jgi:predicted HTH domain antitoxin
VIVMNRDQPDALIVHLDDESLLTDVGVRRALATALYRDGSLSLGKSARVAQMSVAEFMVHASRLGIPLVRGSAVQALADADVIDAWQHASS